MTSPVDTGLTDDIERNEPVAAPVAATPTTVAPLATTPIVVMQQPAVQNNTGVWSPAKIADSKQKVCCCTTACSILACLTIFPCLLAIVPGLGFITIPLGSIFLLAWIIVGIVMCCNGTCPCCPKYKKHMPE